MPYRHRIGATLHLAGGITLCGQAQDFTGWTPASRMRGAAGEIVLTAAWLDVTKGLLEITATPAEQADWRPGRYATDLRLTGPDGKVLISEADEIHLLQPITPP